MPRNAFNQPNAASGATGGGQSTNIYAGGVFELEPDEALIIESRIPEPPQYIGFHLGEPVGRVARLRQSPDEPERIPGRARRRRRAALCRRAPRSGVPNWLDTTGHREGFLTPRWAYSEAADAGSLADDPRQEGALRRDPRASPGGRAHGRRDERAERIRVRQEHVQRRFRVF
jgi:hypothetical protein